jgi:hypothetical protein
VASTGVQKTRNVVRIIGLKQGDCLSPILFKLALQKVIQNIQMVPSSIRIGTEQLNVLAYADGIVLTLNLPTTTIVAQPFNVIEWQLKFNPVA